MTNIHTLNLHYNKNITDEGFKYITNINTLNLYNNKNITDEGLKYIPNIHTLNLHYNKNITDEGLKYIEGCIFHNDNLEYYLKIVKKNKIRVYAKMIVRYTNTIASYAPFCVTAIILAYKLRLLFGGK